MLETGVFRVPRLTKPGRHPARHHVTKAHCGPKNGLLRSRMATLILTVEDVFEITGRGLVVVPGPLEKDYAGPRKFAVRLILPDGDEKIASIRLAHFFQSPPAKENRLACILMGVTKADVPIGTKIWAEG